MLTKLFLWGITCGLFLGIGCGGDDPPPVGNGAPTAVVTPNGVRFNGSLGSSAVFPSLEFAVEDASGNRLSGVWLQIRRITGNGTLSADSLLTGSNGIAAASYTFSQTSASATIRAILPGKDSTDVRIVADALIPVDTSLLTARSVGEAVPGRFPGQGQFLLFDENLATLSAINGPPISAPEDPGDFFNYAEYDQSLGLVFMVWDTNQNGVVTSDEPLRGVIATSYDTPSPYAGRTLDSIRLNVSRLRDLIVRYGAPDTTFLDPTPPPAIVATWRSIGMTVFCNSSADSLVRQINLIELERPAGLAPSAKKPTRPEAATWRSGYRHHPPLN